MTVLDVAAYILAARGEMSAMKLQKLIYYAQAWALAWTGRPLFANRIEAWAKGPVVRDLYALHRGEFTVREIAGGNASVIGSEARAIIDAVLGSYAHLTPQTLSDLTHSEPPWLEARRHAPEGERSSVPIEPASMRAYYGSLARKQEQAEKSLLK